MLVFLVVKPFSPAAVQDSTGQVQSKAARTCPIDIIVVPTTEHQLPLGVLSYRNVKTKALARTAYSRMPQPSTSKMATQHHTTTRSNVIVNVAVGDAVIPIHEHQQLDTCINGVAPKRTFASFVIVFAGLLLLV